MKALRFNGVKAPKGVQTEDELMRLQSTVGVPATGVWDFSSEAAYEKYLKGFSVPLTTAYQVEGYSAPGMVRNQRDVKLMQEVLGNVTVDGIWGPETDGAYKARIMAEQGMDIAYPKPATTAKPIQSAPAANTMPAAFISAPAAAGIAGKTTLGMPVQGGDTSGSSGAAGWEKATVPGTDLQFGSMIEVEVYYGKRLQELWEAYSAAATAATNRKTRTKQDQDALALAHKNYTDMQKEYQAALAAVKEQENRYYSDRFNYYYENRETDEETPFFYNPSDVDEHYEPLLAEAWDAYIAAGNAAGRRGPGQREAAAAADKAYEEYLYLKSLRDQAYQAAQTYEEINGNQQTGSGKPLLTGDFLESDKPLQDYLDYIYDHSDEGRDITLDMIDDFYDDFLPKYTQMLSETTNYVLPEWSPYPYKREVIVAVDEDTNEPHKVLTPNDPDSEEILDVYLSIENGEIPMITSFESATYRPHFNRMPDEQYGTFSCSPYYEANGRYYVSIYMNGEYQKYICVGDEIPYDVEINVDERSVSTYLEDIAKNYFYEVLPQALFSLGTNAALGYAGMSDYDIEQFNNVMELYEMSQPAQASPEVEYKAGYKIYVSFTIYNSQYPYGEEGQGFGIN